jgi:hypothetical protein
MVEWFIAMFDYRRVYVHVLYQYFIRYRISCIGNTNTHAYTCICIYIYGLIRSQHLYILFIMYPCIALQHKHLDLAVHFQDLLNAQRLGGRKRKTSVEKRMPWLAAAHAK